MQFGVSLSTSAEGGRDPITAIRQAEELGFDILTVSDHLHGSHPTFETWTLLTWAAAHTDRIRLMPSVLGLPYRPPPVVAKMAETLQRLSAGRLILGLGGGASDAEFRAWGLDVRTRREKVDALEEAVRLIRGLWSEEELTFDGRHFRATRALLEPKPDPAIPIWLGTYGRRALDVTGRFADGWNPSLPYAPPDVAGAMRDRVRAAAVAAGRDADEVTCAYNVTVYADESAKPNPRMVAGPPDRVAEELANLVSIGFTTLIFWARGGAEQRERLAREVLPAVRTQLD